MKIVSKSAAPFSSIISVFLLTVICQNEASKLKRLDQAVSKAHFEFSLDLYKTLGKILQFIFKTQSKSEQNWKIVSQSFFYLTNFFAFTLLYIMNVVKPKFQSYLMEYKVDVSFWRENLKKSHFSIFPLLFSTNSTN